ncbi:DUF5324 family protein [Kitasatospora sp. NPDC085879]|uniref:DUF5324 family protein n=1 Tax=Kitasatospora sp. NPDC085879 TaxID=3154769 RepID=UPI00343E3B85
MTRLDSARENTGWSKEAAAVYAATAKDAAIHYADEARQRFGPAVEALGPKAAAAGAQARTSASQAAQAARVQYAKHVAPQLEYAFLSLPPGAQQSTLKAVHRAQEAALAAKINAGKAADQAKATLGPKVSDAYSGAKATVVPAAQEAQVRGAAALTALQGHVTAAEISDLAAKNIKKENRSGWATGLAVGGVVAIGAGVFAWQWWRKQNNPEWLVEPPAGANNDTGSPAAGTERPAAGSATAPAPAAADTPVNGSVPHEQQGGEDTPKPDSQPGRPDADRPKPHDPRKPH